MLFLLLMLGLLVLQGVAQQATGSSSLGQSPEILFRNI